MSDSFVVQLEYEGCGGLICAEALLGDWGGGEEACDDVKFERKELMSSTLDFESVERRMTEGPLDIIFLEIRRSVTAKGFREGTCLRG